MSNLVIVLYIFKRIVLLLQISYYEYRKSVAESRNWRDISIFDTNVQTKYTLFFSKI